MIIKHPIHILLIFLLTGVGQLSVQAQRQSFPLNGQWLFALDPMDAGVRNGWSAAKFPGKFLEKVNVPHCFSEDSRYFNYTGSAWYFRSFGQPSLKPGYRAFIRFRAAFYRTEVWVNGRRAGAHEGGYTPFEVDVTGLLKEDNMLTVKVNNGWDTTTIPGAKTYDSTYRPNASQLYAWMNYGGLIRPVELIVRPDIYISNVRITPVINHEKKAAALQVKLQVVNTSERSVSRQLSLSFSGKKMMPAPEQTLALLMPASSEKTVYLNVSLNKQAEYWSPDHPVLYEATASVGSDSLVTSFGIRTVEVKGTKLLLNNEPVRMGGANRPADYPGLGSLDPDSVVIRDLTLMKEAGMEFSRIGHHPVSPKILDWADRNGMLIIAEAGNWQLTPRQMDDTLIRKKYRSQAREMIMRDWNHPSVIAYSLGNEFYSQTEAGKSWVRDMKAFTRNLDSSRLITFASYIVWRDYIRAPEDEASEYVDFISANIYGNHLKNLQHINEIYPGKPVYISEFGIRSTVNKTEEDRNLYFRSALEAIRQCDYVVGASVWSFNDYRSRYPDTDPDGYRRWGLVDEWRRPRPSYFEWQAAYCPATIDVLSSSKTSASLRVTARSDFPAYVMEGYQLRTGTENKALPKLQPGQSATISISFGTDPEAAVVELVKPTGFVVLRKKIPDGENIK